MGWGKAKEEFLWNYLYPHNWLSTVMVAVPSWYILYIKGFMLKKSPRKLRQAPSQPEGTQTTTLTAQVYVSYMCTSHTTQETGRGWGCFITCIWNMQNIICGNQPRDTKIHIRTFTHKGFNQKTDYKVTIPLDCSFPVDFLHFDSIWFLFSVCKS